jgi:hypothetical protein
MVHYGFWNDKYVTVLRSLFFCATDDFFPLPYRSFTSPDVPPVDYPEGFQGNEIPIDGAAVARLCLERLTLSEEADD